MTIGIKTRTFSPNKTERTFDEAGGFGWTPGNEKRFEGAQSNSARYTKNYSRMHGDCVKCGKFTDKPGTAGEHCSLPVNEHCEK